MEKPNATVRPRVNKHLAYFQECVEKLGPEMVRGALKSKDGRYKTARILFKLSKKDKYEMLQALGLADKAGVTV